MAKKDEKGLAEKAGSISTPTESMDEFLKRIGMEDSAQELTFVQRPLVPGEIWFIELIGKDQGEKEIHGRMSTFNIYHAKALKGDSWEGKKFSFIPGGLFDHIIEKKEISFGSKLCLQYTGTVELEDSRKANQWKIVKV